MKTLCMDTSHRHLVLVLLENNEIKAQYVAQAWKKQSETIFIELIKLMNTLHWLPDDLDEVVITKGPGSYTGIRIAMSIAKVLCTRKAINLYTISTLALYAGVQNCHVILDARSNRVYYGHYENGACIEESIQTIEDVQAKPLTNLVGDVDLMQLQVQTIDFANHFKQLRSNWLKVDNVHTLTPEYLKEESAYLVK